MKIIHEYRGSHHYEYNYEKEKWFCPNCGKQELWTSTGPGDYYHGNDSICTACGYSCSLLGGPSQLKEPVDLGVLKQLREQKTAEPTTPEGN